jgi:hypothetical protein
MTSARIATPEQVQAAGAALELGQQLAREYHAAAAASPGVGLAVSLPSVAGPLGPPQGLNFDLPADVPALRKPAPAPRLVPDYASQAVGGLGFHSTTPGTPAAFDGVSWPSPRSSSIAYISPRSMPTLGTRIRRAFEVLLGRRR